MNSAAADLLACSGDACINYLLTLNHLMVQLLIVWRTLSFDSITSCSSCSVGLLFM